MTIELSLAAAGPWTDYSDYAELNDLKREISLNGDNDPQRPVTSDIELYGLGYQFVSTNLINSPTLYTTAIFARVTDTECSGEQFLFKFETENLKWCDDGECRIKFSMELYDEYFECAKKTAIADNWQNEYQAYPASGMPHPRFRYCDVFKPTFVYGMLITIANAVDSIFIVLNALITFINIIVTALGFNPFNYIPYLFSLIGGCRWGWPAPFVRSYLSNACDKCGITIDNTTAPIFYDVNDPLNPAQNNVYYNTCLLTSETKKGVDLNGTKDYIEASKPSWTLFGALSYLKKPWNARWYFRNNTVYMHRKDMLGALMYGNTYGIDLTGSDNDNVLGYVCYSWNGKGKPARIYLKWGTDPSDNIGNQVLNRFNGEWLDLTNAPALKSDIQESMNEFGAASFVLDGDDSLYDANIVNSIGGSFSPITYKRCLKTQGDTLALAKLIIWDGLDMSDARAIFTNYSPYTGCVEFLDDDGPFFPITMSDLKHINYPMSFSPCQNGIANNLWNYWAIDMPIGGKKTNIAFEFKLNYCCSYNSLDLYMKVLFQDGVTEGEINYIQYDYQNRTITIKGNLI